MSAPPRRSTTPSPAVAAIPGPALEELTPYTLDLLLGKDGTFDWRTLMYLQNPNFTDPARLLDNANLDDPNFWEPFGFGDDIRFQYPSPHDLVDKRKHDSAEKSQQLADTVENDQHVWERRLRDRKPKIAVTASKTVNLISGSQSTHRAGRMGSFGKGMSSMDRPPNAGGRKQHGWGQRQSQEPRNAIIRRSTRARKERRT